MSRIQNNWVQMFSGTNYWDIFGWDIMAVSQSGA